jgi:hypothetical protein
MITHKLTKEYYYPVVKGSQFGMLAIASGFKSAFQTFIKGPNGSWLKITNYNNIYNYFFDLKIAYRKGYLVFGKEYEACCKGNKYLKKQYSRMAKALKEEDIVKYTSIFQTLSKRSQYFRTVIFVLKIKYYSNNYSMSKVRYLLDKVQVFMKNESSAIKFKRVFLEERNQQGEITKRRPLGVPNVQSRVESAMYEFYLVNMLKAEWCENQFACMPKVGVVDAWLELLPLANSKSNIVGIDLAKFFDTVFIKTASYALRMSKVPEHIVLILERMHKVKPQVKEKEFERARIKEIMEQAPVMLYPPVEDLMTSVPEANWNNRDISLPQGLNTSPLIACHTLNITNALDGDPSQDYKVIQYVDDGVLIGELSTDKMLRQYTQRINSYTTGIHISEKKTEIIKENGEWKKPLKFLGCEFDGSTFRAHTRKGGVYEVKDANKKIQKILYWLQMNRGNIRNYERKDLSQLINQGWNHQPAWMLLDPNKDLTRWEKERIIQSKVGRNSIEGRVISRYIGSGLPFFGSSNTMSMLCAGELLQGLSKPRVKYTRELRSRASKHDEMFQWIRSLPVK